MSRSLSGRPWKHYAKPLGAVGAGASASAVLSTAIAAIMGNSRYTTSPHVVFLMAAGVIGVLLGFTAYDLGRIPAGFLFAFFLFEPIGPIVLHRQAAPAGLGATLALALALAWYFHHRSRHSARNVGGPVRGQVPARPRVEEREESEAVLARNPVGGRTR